MCKLMNSWSNVVVIIISECSRPGGDTAYERGGDARRLT